MERAEAEGVYERGRDAVVAVLLKLDERIAKQDERIAELERRLNRNSSNSSTPPSQDPPGAPERKRAPCSGRSPGGQPGHAGHGRSLLAAESVDEVEEHWPERCSCCDRRFAEDERAPVGERRRHQVSDLPEIAVVLTEHHLMRLRCPDCGQVTCAELPPDVPTGAFGPRMQAATTTLSVRNRVSRRDVVELAGELFGASISTGTVDAIVGLAGEALDRPYQRLKDDIRAAAAVNVDETGWRLKGAKRTLGGAFTARAALLRIAPDRHERELQALLGEEFAGIASSDRWWAYNGLDPERRQVCWSHLIRDFTAHAEGLAAQKELGEAGLRIAERLFEAWRNFQQDGDRVKLKRAAAPLKRELKALLKTHARKSARHRHTRTFANNLLKVWPALWNFTKTDGVQPTNNHAERGLRGAVIYRKLSLGSQSEQGERAIERLLSVSQTCRLQGRPLFAYLTDVLAAHARGHPAPLLIPTTARTN